MKCNKCKKEKEDCAFWRIIRRQTFGMDCDNDGFVEFYNTKKKLKCACLVALTSTVMYSLDLNTKETHDHYRKYTYNNRRINCQRFLFCSVFVIFVVDVINNFIDNFGSFWEM